MSAAPKPNGEAKPIRYQVLVETRDENEQRRLLEKLEKAGFVCRPIIL